MQLYNTNEHVDAKIKNTIPFILNKKLRKYLDVNPTKHGQNSRDENYTADEQHQSTK